MRLNIGCGDHYAPGWVNVDLHDDHPGGPRPDVVASALDLPFDDGSVESVYCGHVLEHIAPRKLPIALAEIHRVMAEGALLMVVGPDVNLTLRHEPNLLSCVLNGAKRWVGDEHKWMATGGLTVQYLRVARFNARLLPIADVSTDWPVVGRELWQFALEATPQDS